MITICVTENQMNLFAAGTPDGSLGSQGGSNVPKLLK